MRKPTSNVVHTFLSNKCKLQTCKKCFKVDDTHLVKQDSHDVIMMSHVSEAASSLHSAVNSQALVGAVDQPAGLTIPASVETSCSSMNTTTEQLFKTNKRDDKQIEKHIFSQADQQAVTSNKMFYLKRTAFRDMGKFYRKRFDKYRQDRGIKLTYAQL